MSGYPKSIPATIVPSSFASDVAPAHCLVPGDAIIANQFQYAPIFIYYSIVV